MLGESTLGTYVAYGALLLLLLVMVLMVIRVMAWLSLLFLDPVAEMLQRIPGLRRLVRAPHTQNAQRSDPPGGR